MRFNRITISKEISEQKGISNIDIQRLKSLVVFVGKNGSGKSRILDLLESNMFSINGKSLLDNSIGCLPENLNKIAEEYKPIQEYVNLQEKLEELRLKIKKDPRNRDLREESMKVQQSIERMRQANSQIQTVKNQLDKQLKESLSNLKQNYFRRINSSQIRTLERAIESTGSDTKLFENLIDLKTPVPNSNELSVIQASALKYLKKLPNRLTFEYNESFGDSGKYENQPSFRRFQSLKKFVRTFLKKDLTWERETAQYVETNDDVKSSHKGVWKIDNRKFEYLEFSEGEKTLFAYAILFFLLDQNPNLNIKESVILIDEPELHLHPDSEIDLIEALKKVVEEKGQLIISTHSINILSTLNYEEVFMVKGGVIKRPSKSTQGESLNELMGLENRVLRLSDFLSSISTWTHMTFMAQCFLNPDVIESARADDPQVEVFKKAVRERSARGAKILDFGAGKGRLFEQLKSDSVFNYNGVYHALEPNESYHKKLVELGVPHIYKSIDDLPKSVFDFIVLCNVLHEVELAKWEQSLNKIIESLKEDGHLIIIEVKALKKGEKIGKSGFLLLDAPEIQALFNLSNLPTLVKIDGKTDSGICAAISKGDLNSVTVESIRKCLTLLQENTLDKIKKLREVDDATFEVYGYGRESAFLSQQNINARLSLDQLNDLNLK